MCISASGRNEGKRPDLKNTRPIFQLWAGGESRNGWPFKMRSKEVFTNRQDATAHITEFEARCYDETQLECAVPGSLKTTVVELELHD